jgi:hypothetical protein
MSVLVIILLLAFLVESLTEYLFGKLFDQVVKLKPYRWTLMYIAAVVGVVGCFLYGFDLLALLGGFLPDEGAAQAARQASWFGTLLTGLAVGRGSNYIHDLVAKFFVKGVQPSAVSCQQEKNAGFPPG